MPGLAGAGAEVAGKVEEDADAEDEGPNETNEVSRSGLDPKRFVA